MLPMDELLQQYFRHLHVDSLYFDLGNGGVSYFRLGRQGRQANGKKNQSGLPGRVHWNFSLPATTNEQLKSRFRALGKKSGAEAPLFVYLLFDLVFGFRTLARVLFLFLTRVDALGAALAKTLVFALLVFVFLDRHLHLLFLLN
jgi:hypothetical protein